MYLQNLHCIPSKMTTEKIDSNESSLPKELSLNAYVNWIVSNYCYAVHIGTVVNNNEQQILEDFTAPISSVDVAFLPWKEKTPPHTHTYTPPPQKKKNKTKKNSIWNSGF